MSLRTRTRVSSMTRVAIMVCLICICSWITIPAPVPFTLQTLAIYLAVLLLTKREAACSIVIYVLLGLVGVPVFSGFGAGLATLLGPTGGYIWGFLLMALIGLIIPSSSITILAGTLVSYALGTLSFSIYSGAEFSSLILVCVLPFIVPDLIKFLLAKRMSSLISKALSRKA